MVKTGLLIVTNPSRAVRIVPHVQKHLLNKLYIQYLPGRLSRLLRNGTASTSTGPPSACLYAHSQAVIGLYSQSLGQNLDVTVLLAHLKNPHLSVVNTKKSIDVVFFDHILNGDEVNTFVKNCLPNTKSQCPVVSVPEGEEVDLADLEEQEISQEEVKMYDNVVLGGTFDRLHAGHKILLSEAVLRCQKKLTVGVTDASMLRSKYLSELIAPCELRMSDVREFLEDVDPYLEYDVVPISDPFGPTKYDPDFEMIVVSDETLKGGVKVNELRAQNSLKPLVIHSVDLLTTTSKQEKEEEDKVSSGNLRLRALGTRLNTPEPRPHLPTSPYIIGLTGGIASGKSSVGQRLAELGAGLVDCDLLAHGLYKQGQPLYKKLIEHFGKDIVNSEGEIDRKALGSIVFSDKAQLAALNGILWPALLERTKQEISTLYANGHNIVVVEAAVLKQAGWMKHCHEVWVCIIPPEEAIRRLQERNSLTLEAAQARVSAQPNNTEQVVGATTVLSTLWSYDFTQRQVARAWRYLHEYLEREVSPVQNKL